MNIADAFVKNIADCFVIAGLIQCVLRPLLLIFTTGDLWGPSAFLCGAIIVASILFGEFYFRDEV